MCRSDPQLVASQVVLSMALPFVSLPLLLLTNSRVRMSAEITDDLHQTSDTAAPGTVAGYGATSSSTDAPAQAQAAPSRRRSFRYMWNRLPQPLVHFFAHLGSSSQANEEQARDSTRYVRSFQNAWYIQILAWAIFLLICIADIYVLYETIKDPSSA